MESINNVNVMNFKQDDLLNKNDIEKLIVSVFTNEKSTIISKKLKSYCFFVGPDLYLVQDNITFTKYCQKTSPLMLISMVSRYLEMSYKNMSEDESKLIRLEHSKQYSKIFSNSNIDSYKSQLQIDLTITKNIKFDDTPYEIHFRNGYYDLKDRQFKNREIFKHYITKYINRDYKQSTTCEQKIIQQYLTQIYSTNIEDKECVLQILGSALTGKSTNNQECLFLLGLGSTGKSLVMKLIQLCVSVYVMELKSDTFCQSNSKIDKQLCSYVSNPQIRISWINEMKDSMNDGSLFKSFIDGEIKTTELYKDGQISTNHNSIVVGTANEIPGFKMDSGIVRRIRGLTHKSSFTDDQTDILKTPHTYLKDNDLLDKLTMGNSLNAFFDILAEKCYECLSGKKIVYTENFDQTKENVVGANDKIQDFIDGSLIITNNETDRISKDEMVQLFKDQFNGDYKSIRRLISELQDKKIKYSCQFRLNNIKGCFYGVRVRDFMNDTELGDNTDVKFLNDIVEDTEKDLLIKQLQKKIQELEDQISSQSKQTMTIKSSVKITSKSKSENKRLSLKEEQQIQDEKNDHDDELTNEDYKQMASFF